MYTIQPLDWDTHFFGYKVGKISLSAEEISTLQKIEIADYKLIYLFAAHSIEEYLLKQWGAQLQDIKIEFVRTVDLSDYQSYLPEDMTIKPIHTFSEELFHLVLESGVHSRFKLDKNFVNNEFERLYKTWIEKALNDKDAKVMGAYLRNELMGFVCLTLKSGVADIGLIAVHEKARGNHIGKKLLEAAYNYTIQNNSKSLTVVTQEFNLQAMHFYLKNGFKIDKKNYIYHIWKK